MRESGIPEIPHDLHPRAYVLSFGELVDRLTIVQLKSVFLSENKVEYDKEIALILCDIDAILSEKNYQLNAKDIRAICVTMLANRCIWESESKARQGGSEAEGNLRKTHSLNGVRNTAKNILAQSIGDRTDKKIDCLAADLPDDMGNWRIW